jgi:hypothetical protein
MRSPQRTLSEARSQPVVILHDGDASALPVFRVTTPQEDKFEVPVSVCSPYQFPVDGQPGTNLMQGLRMYLERFPD